MEDPDPPGASMPGWEKQEPTPRKSAGEDGRRIRSALRTSPCFRGMPPAFHGRRSDPCEGSAQAQTSQPQTAGAIRPETWSHESR